MQRQVSKTVHWLRNPLIWVLAVYAVSRIFYAALGIRFNASDLDIFWQLPDRQWLLSRLGETLYYMHSQPPLFALLVGLVLHANPSQPEPIFTLIYLVFGLLLTVTMYETLKLLRVPPVVSAVATTFFMISPATVIYENWLFYTYPVASLLMATFYFLFRFAETGQFRDGVLFVSLISSVALMRSTFHLIWVLVLAGLALMIARRCPWRWWLRVAVLAPSIIVLSLYVKNYVVFGTFNSSSWLGLSLHRMMTIGLTDQQRQDLIASKQLTYDTLKPDEGFLPISAYGSYTDRAEFDSIPALASDVKPTLGNINLNHYAYIEFSGKRMHDALIVLRSCPGCYAYAAVQAFVIFSRTATSYLMFENTNNYVVTAPIRQFFDEVVYGKQVVQAHLAEGYEVSFYPRMMILIPTLFLLSIRKTIFALRTRDQLAIPLAAMVGTTLFASASYILLDIGENNRFRFELDPLIFSLGMLLVWNIYKDAQKVLNRSRSHRNLAVER